MAKALAMRIVTVLVRLTVRPTLGSIWPGHLSTDRLVRLYLPTDSCPGKTSPNRFELHTSLAIYVLRAHSAWPELYRKYE